MTHPVEPSRLGVERLKRVALVILGAAVFLGVASVVKPPPRGASAQLLRTNPRSTDIKPIPAAASKPNDHESIVAQRERLIVSHPERKDWRLIGILEGRDFTVFCHATPNGPLYSVFNREGVLMQAGMQSDEVYRSFPDVDLENMQLDPSRGVPLMMMDLD